MLQQKKTHFSVIFQAAHLSDNMLRWRFCFLNHMFCTEGSSDGLKELEYKIFNSYGGSCLIWKTLQNLFTVGIGKTFEGKTQVRPCLILADTSKGNSTCIIGFYLWKKEECIIRVKHHTQHTFVFQMKDASICPTAAADTPNSICQTSSL